MLVTMIASSRIPESGNVSHPRHTVSSMDTQKKGIGNAQHFRWMRVALAYVCKILKGLNMYILTLSALTTLHMRIR